MTFTQPKAEVASFRLQGSALPERPTASCQRQHGRVNGKTGRSMAYHPRTMSPNEPKNGILSDVNAGDCLCTLGVHMAETRKLNKAAARVVRLSFTGDWMLLGSRMAARAGIAVGWKASGKEVHLCNIGDKETFEPICLCYIHSRTRSRKR